MPPVSHSFSSLPRPLRGYILAGGLVFLGLTAFMFWLAAPAEAPAKAEAGTAAAARKVEPMETLASLPRTANALTELLRLETTLAGDSKPEITEPMFEEISLTRRLEDYYLTDVLLENVQLGMAMSILRTKLQETDSERALALHRLAVTMPTAAMGRRVTLFSQSIPYLTAVQNVATQAGCTVEVTENRITLKLQPGPYPQTARKGAMKDLLSGLRDDEGRPLSESSEALSHLSTLASQLGIQFDFQGNASLTENQWAALRQMQDYQSSQASNALPTFALYILPAGFLPPDLNSDPMAVYNLLVNLHLLGYRPYSRLPEGMDPTVAYQILMLFRRGEAIVLTLFDIPATETVAEVDQEPEPATTSLPQMSAGFSTGAILQLVSSVTGPGNSISTSAGLVLSMLTGNGVSITNQVVTPPAVEAPQVTPTAPASGSDP
ncbi:hypothetical protein [Prosthecobacter fusiformis]|nr:hypothetical protein [Prosthecobacter fusiformis]